MTAVQHGRACFGRLTENRDEKPASHEGCFGSYPITAVAFTAGSALLRKEEFVEDLVLAVLVL